VDNGTKSIHYARDPILEAFVGFDWETEDEEATRPATDPRLLDELGTLLASEYPRSQPISYDGRFLRSGNFDDPAAKGRAYATEDGKQVVRAFNARFTFHRLAPYRRWEPFVAEAHRIAELYHSVFPRRNGEVQVVVRYLNVFSIPLEHPLHEFFNVYPAWPERDVLFTRVFMRVATAFEEPHGHLTTFFLPRGDEYNTAVSRPDDPNSFDMILDNIFDYTFADDRTAWATMDSIRKKKNDTFNSQITPRLRESIQ
jgi:uncharacterized protein (TIGR04255 family)